MTNENKPLEKIIVDLKERAKELNCLYEVQEILSKFDDPIEKICKGIINAIPPGWQYPDVCQACITLRDEEHKSEGFIETAWRQSADIIVRDEAIGHLCVSYSQERPASDEGPFLKEERKLINTIAELIGSFMLHKQLKTIFEEEKQKTKEQKTEWLVIIDLLKRTDTKLLIRISRRMVNYLFWKSGLII